MEKTEVSITMFISELLYEVQNKTYLTGMSRKNGNNHEEVANMQANDDDENINQLLRSIQNSSSTLKTKLSDYIVDTSLSSSNELIGEGDDYTFVLTVPTNYNHSTVETITSSMHQYIVNTATGDWFSITNKADAENYYRFASDNLEMIREALNKRVRPNRRGAEDKSSRFGNTNKQTT